MYFLFFKCISKYSYYSRNQGAICDFFEFASPEYIFCMTHYQRELRTLKHSINWGKLTLEYKGLIFSFVIKDMLFEY